MNKSFLELTTEFLLKISPIVTSVILIFLDSIPKHFGISSFTSFFGFCVLYTWVIIDHEKIRPFFILLLSVLIDILSNLIFGLTSIFMFVIFLIQRKNSEFLLSESILKIWIRFMFFFVFYFIFIALIHKIVFKIVYFDFLNVVFSIALTGLMFPLLFWAINLLNNELKFRDE